MNSFDQYLGAFSNLYWNIPSGGDLGGILFIDTNKSLVADMNRYQQLIQPLSNFPIKLYFEDENGDKVGIQYPAGMSFLHILGAINTFYDQPVSQDFIYNLREYPEAYEVEKNYPFAAEKLRYGKVTPTRRDFLPNRLFFAGLEKSNDGYKVLTRTI